MAIIILTMYLGGVCNLISDKNSGHTVHDCASILEAKILFSRHNLLKKIQPDLVSLTNKPKIISVDKPCEGFDHGCLSIGNLFHKETTKICSTTTVQRMTQKVEIDPESLTLIFTSINTDGTLKLIPRTHKNLCYDIASCDNEGMININTDEIISGFLTSSDHAGIWTLLTCIHQGSTFLILDNLSDLDEILSMINDFRVIILFASPEFLRRFCCIGTKLTNHYDTASLKHIFANNTIDSDIPKDLINRFELESVYRIFGITEAG